MVGRWSVAALAALWIPLVAASPVCADFDFADADLFVVRYVDAGSGVVTIGPADATAFQLLPSPTGVIGKWSVPVLGTTAHVYVGLAVVDATTTRWSIGIVHTRSLPAGWRVEYVDRRFALRHTSKIAAPSDVLHIAKTYGPTRHVATIGWDDKALYPNFLQTQQATLENTTDGGAISLLIDDDSGHRKSIVYRTSSSTDVRELSVRSYPENEPLDWLFVPAYDVVLRGGLRGLDGALAWYRTFKKASPNSFLSRRAAEPRHPLLVSHRFTVAIGAVQTGRPVGVRFDLTPGYRNAVLRDFGGLHGGGMFVYHLGWENSVSTVGQCILPDIALGIMPGYRSMLVQAGAQGHFNIPYFLPIWVNQNSVFYDATQLRTGPDGTPDVQMFAPCGLSGPFGLYSWQAPGTAPLYDNVVVDTMIQQHGFDGCYLDALDASTFSYNLAHDPPAGQNEQLAGIEQWIAGARARARTTVSTELLLANETPTEVFGTDISALDPSAVGNGGLNLFRRTYTGAEWPTVSAIEGLHPILMSYQLARVLADGTRPLIVWPEWDGVYPQSIASSAGHAGFWSMLRGYVQRFQGARFDRVIDGALLARVPAVQVNTIPPIAALSGVGGEWNQSVPAIFHGVFAPTHGSDSRVIPLARWTDPSPSVIGDLGLPTSHPLRNAGETIVLPLGKAVLGLNPSQRYVVRVYDTLTGATQTVGQLPALPSATLSVTRVLTPSSIEVIFVDPV